MPEEKLGKMTVSAAGQRGGLTTKRRYGSEFYRDIGRKGGRKVAALVDAGKAALAALAEKKAR